MQRARSAVRDAPPAARSLSWFRPTMLLRAACAVAGLALFALALEITRAGAGSLAPLLSDINVEGVANALGFGWLFAYVVLSGSPVAAIGVTLLSEGVFHTTEAFAVIAGSRLGASFIVLAVGFLANQNMLRPDDEITGIDIDDELDRLRRLLVDPAQDVSTDDMHSALLQAVCDYAVLKSLPDGEHLTLKVNQVKSPRELAQTGSQATYYVLAKPDIVECRQGAIDAEELRHRAYVYRSAAR